MNLGKLTSTFSGELEGISGDTTQITREKRNDYINKVLTIIDVQYSSFINNLGSERRAKDTATDILELSMNLAGTAVGAATTKTVLAAISAGVTGTNSILDKNYFYDLALPSLIAQMNADRTEVYRTIVSGMQRDTTGNNAYLWAQAVRDLVEYYNAGTLQHAASSIRKEAGARQEAAEQRIDGILMVAQKATQQDVQARAALTDGLNNISSANLVQVRTILVPLSQALSHLPDCHILDTQQNGTVEQVKRALQLCIQNVSAETNRSFQDDHTEIAKRFKEVGLIQ
jgi:hypothetical protein